MDISINSNQIKRILLFTPAILALVITLVPTLKYQLPLSWDIYYHIHMSKLYFHHGFTLWDSITYAPFGRPIYYPPFFHFLLGSVSQLFQGDSLLATRILQPFLAFGVVFSFTYMVNRIYGLSVSFISGFLIILSLPFHRFMLPIPESLSSIFFSISICVYYLSLENNKPKYGIIAGILVGMAFLTHPSAALVLFLVLVLYNIMLKIFGKDYNLLNFLFFILSAFLVSSLWWLPLLLIYGYVSQFPTVIIPLSDYLRVFGMLSLIFVPLGFYILIKNRKKNDFLVLTWLISLLVASQIYLLGINVLSDRILNFAVFPMVITAALGVNYFKSKNKWLFYGLTLLIIVFAVPSGFLAADKSEPFPSTSQIAIADWFEENGDSKSVVLATDFTMEPVIVAFSGQPVAGGGYGAAKLKELDRQKYMNFQFTLEDLKQDRLGYLVFNNDQKSPPYSELVYQNQDYKIFRMENM